MMRKKRGYKREVELVRDYKLFAIACEGGKREPAYFKLFRFLSKRIAVDVIEDVVDDEGVQVDSKNRSAPKWVLDRAVKYIEKEGLSDLDDLWFVMDVDRWSSGQIHMLADLCREHSNWHIVLSNPCFEIWLYLHKKSDFSSSASNTCADFKNEISIFEKGGYSPLKFVPFFMDAIQNAKNIDKDRFHFYPEVKVSKVYHLGEAILSVIGEKGFNTFLSDVLPSLVKIENEKVKVYRKKK